MMLDPFQRASLIDATSLGIREINRTIQRLKKECPQAFHAKDTLASRMFYHRPPEHTPCGGYVDGQMND
jgi:hypothetical protein